jgi:hypothetical protein
MSHVFSLTPTLSLNTENVLGEREEIVRTLTQGGARGDGGPAAPGSRLPWATTRRPLGLYEDEAASCRFANVQSPRQWPEATE